MSGMIDVQKWNTEFKMELYRPYGIARMSRRVATFFYKHGKLFHKKIWVEGLKDGS